MIVTQKEKRMGTDLQDKYITGVLWQDFQHGQLIDLFEKIKLAREQKKDKNLYRYAIAFLAMYVNHHFKLEEQYMKKYAYPDAGDHIREHKEFVKELKAFRDEKIRLSDKNAEELLTRIEEWILSHILDVDKHLAEYILDHEKENGV